MSLPNNLMFLMRPVLSGLCKYESLKDGTLDLYDIKLMNDALLVDKENEWRMYQANQKD